MIGYKTVLIAVFIGVIPAVAIIWWLFLEEKEKIDINLLLKIFFWGVLAAVPASIFQIINLNHPGHNFVVIFFQNLAMVRDNYFLTHSVVPFLFVAIVEEFSKGLGMILAFWSLSKSRKASQLNIHPGALAGVIVGLAFGVTENGVYFTNNFTGQIITSSLVSIILLRFILSTSAHIIYSGLFGAFLVDILINKTFFKKFLAVIGLGIPIAIHTLFNILVTTNEMGILSIPLLLVGLVILLVKIFWSLFFQKDNF